jgi:hypothetical protein
MANINTKRVWLGALAGWLAWAVWSMVTNFAVLTGKYATALEAGTLLKEPRYSFFAPAWFVVLFLLSLGISCLYASARATRGAGPKTAITIGLLVGFAAGFPVNFCLATWGTFGRLIPFWWMLQLWVGAVLAAFFAGWVYRD